MGRYLARQLLTIIPTICLAVVMNFVLLHAAPGDPARIYAGFDNASEQQIAEARRALGLDQPLPVQFVSYVGTLLQGNLGFSFALKRPVAEVIAERVPATLLLTLTSAITAVVVGAAAAVVAARRPLSPADAGLSFLSYSFYAMPSFWLGLILILLFSSTLRWFPTSGMEDVRAEYTGWRHTLDVLQHLALPALTLVLVQSPIYYRITRSSLVQQQREDYMTTFRATGMAAGRVFRRYALRNAILPTVTVFGLNLGYVVTGAALVEIVFAWPGVGRLTLDAVFRRDYPLLLGIYLIIAITVSIAALASDLVYAALDPRIRLR